MAADTYLLDHAQEPTLRLYSWEGPWLSLGYAQRDNWLDADHIRGLGVGIVRRPSGGRAVLHQHEITYAIVLPQAPHASLEENYGALTALWEQAIPNLSRAAGAVRSHTNPSCYQLTQRGELCLQGRKLIGSAQVRKGKRLLQHGSIPLRVDHELFEAIFPGAAAPAALGDLTPEQLAHSFPRPLEPQPWSPVERAHIGRACLA
jgi:lipoate-protein ligase A